MAEATGLTRHCCLLLSGRKDFLKAARAAGRAAGRTTSYLQRMRAEAGRVMAEMDDPALRQSRSELQEGLQEVRRIHSELTVMRSMYGMGAVAQQAVAAPGPASVNTSTHTVAHTAGATHAASSVENSSPASQPGSEAPSTGVNAPSSSSSVDTGGTHPDPAGIMSRANFNSRVYSLMQKQLETELETDEKKSS